MITIAAQNLASAEFQKVGADATRMGGEVKASATGFHEVQRASEATTVSLRTTAMAFASISMMGSMIVSVAEDFGVLDKEAAKQTRTFLHLITLIGAITRVKHYLATVTGAAASAQAAHTAAVAANTGAVAGSTAAHVANTSAVAGSTASKTANVGATISSTIAEKVHAAANILSAKATWVLNAALAMKVALLTLGVGLVIATAAYMAWLASTTRDAASAQMEYNESLQYRQRVGKSRFEEEQYERITRRGGYV